MFADLDSEAYDADYDDDEMPSYEIPSTYVNMMALVSTGNYSNPRVTFGQHSPTSSMGKSNPAHSLYA